MLLLAWTGRSSTSARSKYGGTLRYLINYHDYLPYLTYLGIPALVRSSSGKVDLVADIIMPRYLSTRTLVHFRKVR